MEHYYSRSCAIIIIGEVPKVVGAFLCFRGTYVLKDKRLRPSEFAKAIRTIRLIKGLKVLKSYVLC